MGRVMDLANRAPTRLAIDVLAPQAGEAILDAGCGTGAAMERILRRTPCRVTGIDPSPTMIEAARRKLGQASTDLYCATVEQMPFAPGSFDAALALNVLYFCGPDNAMIAALHRVLKPGGRLVAYVSHRETMEDWPFARQGMHRLYDAHELTDALCLGGFARERICVQEVTVTRSVRGLLALATREG